MVSKTPAKATPGKVKTPFGSGGKAGNKSPGGKANFGSPALKSISKQTSQKTPNKPEAKSPITKQTPNKVKTPAGKNIPTAKAPAKTEVKEELKDFGTLPEKNGKPQKTPGKPQKTPAKPKVENVTEAAKSPKPNVKSPKSEKKPSKEVQKAKTQDTQSVHSQFLKIITSSDTTVAEIKEGIDGLFSAKLLRKSVKKDKEQKSFLLRFVDEESAKNGVAKLKAKTGKVLDVSNLPVSVNNPNVVYSKTKLFVTGFPPGFHLEDVKKIFPEATITRPKSKRNKRGSYFLELPSEELAAQTLKKVQNTAVKNQKLIVDYSMEKQM